MQFNAFWNNKKLTVLKARVSAFPLNRVWPGHQRPLDQTEMVSFISFDIEGPGDLKVEIPDIGTHRIEIRPLEEEYPRGIEDNMLIVHVERPGQFVVEIDGKHCVLHVFANPPFNEPHVQDEIYFGPGVHHAGIIRPKSGQTVRIDEGAIVYGGLYIQNAEHVNVVGRGVLDASGLPRPCIGKKTFEVDELASGIVVHSSSDVTIEGIVLRDAPFWAVIVQNGCRRVVLNNIKLIGMWRYNSDGIDICASSDVTIRNSFIRSYDDCIVARGAYLKDETQDLCNMLVDNCVLWCDWGKSIEVWAGNRPCLISGVTFRNCSLIHLSAIAFDVTTWYGSSDTHIRNITFENITVNLGETLYTPQIQNSDSDTYCWKSDWPFKLFVIDCDRLGPVVGDQVAGEAGDISMYHLVYDGILLKNIRFAGKGDRLESRVSTKFERHEICNITLENVETEHILLDGDINNFSIKGKKA